VIVGIGTDMVEVSRVASLLDRHGERFLARVFTEEEGRYALSGRRPAERLSGRFAVKEAVLKALGTGKAVGILWKDVETVRGRGGAPEVRLHGEAAAWLARRGGGKVHVTITHDGGKALAFVVIEGSGEEKP
jgi:holo-[acyl-carrier protein] synthase